MKTIRYFIAILILSSPVALSQPGPGPGQGPMREKTRQRIRTIKIWQLTKAVGLTPEQSEKFFPIYNKHQEAMQNLKMEKQEALKRLNSLTEDPQASDDDISKAMKEIIDDFARRSIEMRQDYMEEVSTVMWSRQQGKLLVFEEDFQRKLQEIMRDIRRDFRDRRMRD
jgi:argonaute-like protein implicated in RNA metabolism and viral defense